MSIVRNSRPFVFIAVSGLSALFAGACGGTPDEPNDVKVTAHAPPIEAQDYYCYPNYCCSGGSSGQSCQVVQCGQTCCECVWVPSCPANGQSCGWVQKCSCS